jgi:hypothetical protein
MGMEIKRVSRSGGQWEWEKKKEEPEKAQTHDENFRETPLKSFRKVPKAVSLGPLELGLCAIQHSHITECEHVPRHPPPPSPKVF